MEKRGKPTVTVLTDKFVPLGNGERVALGMPDLPVVTIPHPVAGLGRERVRANVDVARAFDQAVRGLAQPVARPAPA